MDAHLRESPTQRPRVTKDNRADHDERDQDKVKEMVGARVINQKAEEQSNVAIAVDHGIKEAAEGCDLIGSAGHAAIHHVKDTGPDDHQSGVWKHSGVVL